MTWQFTPIALLYLVAALLSWGIAYLAWQRRPARGSTSLTLLSIAASLWSLGYLLGFFSTDPTTKLIMLRVEYLGIAFSPFLWMVFVLRYTHFHTYATKTLIGLMGIIPVTTVIINATNDLHSLFYTSYTFVTSGDLLLSEKVYGPYFWVHVGYSYIMVFVASVLLLLSVIRHPALYRQQVRPLIVAALVPIVANLTYLTGFNPFGIYDSSSLAFVIATLTVMYSMQRFKLLDVVPVAHDLVIRNMADGVIIVDQRGRVVEINPMAQTMFSTTADAAYGQRLSDVMTDDNSQMTTGATDEMDAEITIRGRIYEMRISPIVTQAETLSGRVLMFHDVTARKQTQMLLAEAKLKAEEASQSKSTFLANMSHELRTPLNAILGYTELLLSNVFGELNEQQRERLMRVSANGEALRALIDDVLDLSKIEAGHMEVETLSFSGPELVEEVKRTVEPLMTKNNNTLTVTISDEVGDMRTDRTKVRQVLLNLLSNAAKFTEKGKVMVRVALSDDCVVFEVEDTGIGMNNEVQSRVFKSFTQADSSTTRKYGGTGLGLAISSHFCQMLGGTLEVESVEGEGTTFTARIPREFQTGAGPLVVAKAAS